MPRIDDLDRSEDVRSIYWLGNGPTTIRAEERLVVRFDQSHGKARGESRDSADSPTVRQAFRPGQFVHGQRVVVAGHEIVGAVESGKSTTEFRIDGIELLAVTRRIVEGLAERVADQSLKPAAGVPPIELRGVVRGNAGGNKVRV